MGERESLPPGELATLKLDASAQGGALLTAKALTVVLVTREGAMEHALARGQTCTIGRDGACDIHVLDRSISRKHVRFTYSSSGELIVEDLGSANGTRVRGQTLGAGAKLAVSPGEVLQIGTLYALVEREGARDAPPQETSAAASAGDKKRSSVLTTKKSPGMDALHALVDRVARSVLSVLVLGETGAGKEVLAQRIHDLSLRAGHPFLKLNCAALSESLLESELFGHERGAFTGAVVAKPGLLETADTGTIFLDEVGELPLSLQAKLLRVLEDRRVLRVGALKSKEIDVRFIAATNRDLLAEVAAGRFRQDLYFRLNGISLSIPPLRERVGEIAPLALRFAASTAKTQGRTTAPTFSPRARRALEAHSWPGNVRELKNVVERAVVLSDKDVLDDGELGLQETPVGEGSAPSRTDAAASGDAGAPLKDQVEALEDRRIVDALANCGGNQTRAAKLLGISRGTLVSRLERLGVSRPRKNR